MNDRLDILRAKYLDAITVKEHEIRQLRDKLKILDELDSDCQKLTESPAPNKLKYAGSKLTKVIYDAVQNIGRNGGVSATDVRKYITANGYKHAGKNFDVATVIALSRMAERGDIQTEKVGNKRLYKAVNISEFK
jgi:hypothetical protein